MKSPKFGLTERLLAVLLAVVVLLGTIPAAAVNVKASQTDGAGLPASANDQMSQSERQETALQDESSGEETEAGTLPTETPAETPDESAGPSEDPGTSETATPSPAPEGTQPPMQEDGMGEDGGMMEEPIEETTDPSAEPSKTPSVSDSNEDPNPTPTASGNLGEEPTPSPEGEQVDIEFSVTGPGELKLQQGEQEKADITIEWNGGESESPKTGTAKVEKDATVTVCAQPKGNARLKTLSINDENKVESMEWDATKDSCDFQMEGLEDAESPISVNAVFVPYYTVRISDLAEGGSAELALDDESQDRGQKQEGTLEVEEGGGVKLTVSPADGYQIQSVAKETAPEAHLDPDPGEEEKVNKTYTIKDIKEDTTFIVKFVKVHVIEVTFDANGEVTCEQVQFGDGGKIGSVEDGESITLTATANPGYHVSGVVVNQISKDEEWDNSFRSYTFTLENIRDRQVIEVTFAPNVYTVTKDEGGTDAQGQLEILNGNYTYNSDTLVTVDVTAAEGYNITSVILKNAEKKEDPGITLPIERMGEWNSLVESHESVNGKVTANRTGNGKIKVTLDKLLQNTVVGVEFGAFQVEDASEWNDINEKEAFQSKLKEKFGIGIQATEDNVPEPEAGKGLYYYSAISFQRDNNEKGIVAGKSEEEIKRILSQEGTAVYDASSFAINTTQKIQYIAFLEKGKWKILKLPTPVCVVVDKNEPKIQLEEIDGEENYHLYEGKKYYNKDVKVKVIVTDPTESLDNEQVCSGLKRVTYTVKVDGKPVGNEEVIFPKGDSAGKITESIEETITLDAATYQGKEVILTVTAEDHAGYETTENLTLIINPKSPTVTIEMTEQRQPNAEADHYTERTATIQVTDREDTFDAQELRKGITISATNGKGESVKGSEELKEALLRGAEVITAESEIEGMNTYTLTIPFSIEGKYTWSLKYANKAGLSWDSKVNDKENESTDRYSFTVDNTAPTGTISVEDGGEEWNVWRELLATLTFGKRLADRIVGFWNHSITVNVTAEDTISSSVKIEYLIEDVTKDKNQLLKEEELKGKNFTLFESPVTLDSKKQAVVYAKLTDAAGNVAYLSTAGIIVEDTESGIALTPETNNQYAIGEGGRPPRYNGDVTVSVKVQEMPEGNEIYSGIQKIAYEVKSGGQTTQKETLYDFIKNTPNKIGQGFSYSDLEHTWNDTITVEAAKNNSPNVELTVTVTDNAGNEKSESLSLSINTTKPTARITFDDTSQRTEQEKEGKRGWFNKPRTATIVITDRKEDFDPQKVELTYSAENLKGEKIVLSEDDVRLSEWMTEENLGDPDKTTHTATLIFQEDGKYTWEDIHYTNKAGLGFEKGDIETVDSQTPFCFTVDTQPPKTAKITAGKSFWDKVLETLTFGLYQSDAVLVSAEAEDAISPLTLSYYIAEGAEAVALLGEEVLEEKEFKLYENEFSISPDKTFVVYLKAQDYAGNFVYRMTDGYITEHTPSQIVLTPGGKAQGAIPYFNQSKVNVGVTVTDDLPARENQYSGVKKVTYQVVKDGDEEHPTAEGELYDFEKAFSGKTVTYEDLVGTGKYNISVDASKNNSSDVVVCVTAVDNAGNESTARAELDIDITAPEIEVSFDNNTETGKETFFNEKRTATVVVTERSNHFDEAAASEELKSHIKAVNRAGIAVANAYTIGEWTHQEKEGDPDGDTHTVTVSFTADANFTFEPVYTDKAGNKSGEARYAEGTAAPKKFTVDTTAPTGVVKAVSDEGRSTEWDRMLGRLDFGYWSQTGIQVTATSADTTSADTDVQYYKVSSQNTSRVGNMLTVEQLEQVSAWTDLGTGLKVTQNERFVVYIRLTDAAGNTAYLCTDGLIVDSEAPLVENLEPEISITTVEDNVGLYSSDAAVSIEVSEPEVNGSYSGLREVSYTVSSLGSVTAEETLFSFTVENPTEEDLQRQWNEEILISAADNNSNEVVVEVYAEDNAGNSVKDELVLSIDTTAPVIEVTYDNNNADSESYFREDRTATISILERNLRPEDVEVTITSSEDVIPAISSWSKSGGSGNLDDTRWTATVTYSADGDYTFDVTCVDMAQNQAEEADYGDSVMPVEFTIDKTLPTVTVSYDNNEAANGRYFSQGRTATITVVEHNFDPSRVTLTQTGTLEGSPVTLPSASWSSNGDSHVAALTYTADGDYTFDITLTDLAGNESQQAGYGSSVAGDSFTVDQSIEKPRVSGVENGKAYKDDVVLRIDFSDVNYDSYDVQLLRTRLGERDIDVTDQFITGMVNTARGGSGTYDTFEKKVENDGIYTLRVTARDLAGNQEEETVVFTLNRFGSVYVYDEYLASLIRGGGAYVTAVEKDLVVTEYNADRLEGDSLRIEVTRDGRPLEEVRYDVAAVENNQIETAGAGWFSYGYTISRENFSADGVYKISVSSRDATGNTPESTPENSLDENGNAVVDVIQFRVDSTAPEINSIVGLEKNIVNDSQLAVRYTVFDTIGLQSVTVYVDGGQYGETAADFSVDPNNYIGEFVLRESAAPQTVRIVARDMAGNVTDTDSDSFTSAYDFNRSVTVSTNALVRFLANKPLMAAAAGGTAVAGGGAWSVMALRRGRFLRLRKLLHLGGK